MKGESFATLAILYSEDPGSSRNGGLYNAIKRGMFVKEFEAVMFNLKMVKYLMFSKQNMAIILL